MPAADQMMPTFGASPMSADTNLSSSACVSKPLLTFSIDAIVGAKDNTDCHHHINSSSSYSCTSPPPAHQRQSAISLRVKCESSSSASPARPSSISPNHLNRNNSPFNAISSPSPIITNNGSSGSASVSLLQAIQMGHHHLQPSAGHSTGQPPPQSHPFSVTSGASSALTHPFVMATHHVPHLTNEYHQAVAFYPWLLRSNPFSNRIHGMPFEGAFSSYLLPFRKPKRIRTAFSPGQLLKLEQAFEKNHYVVGNERKQLANNLGLSETQVKVWFQNRRTKHKRQKQEEEQCSSGSVHQSAKDDDLKNTVSSDEEEEDEIDLDGDDENDDEKQMMDVANIGKCWQSMALSHLHATQPQAPPTPQPPQS